MINIMLYELIIKKKGEECSPNVKSTDSTNISGKKRTGKGKNKLQYKVMTKVKKSFGTVNID